ncbi:galactose-6-phosphate isomerase subunit LacA [Salisediminibacterium halotolerans]|uniref:Galactose-6-phosphate isomerase n=1 Tax=Salisediminibacterium halotolerans TaxID=517425 RepID=A0A1H9U7N0_9BACI|nr:galactose-6-phosphate isomerase subunit LacA [Salisediminibacterium haloalkalitolerans]SES05271.1 galactose-6-phosphate isomerase [Salisediminibacterium haloalkalitolerans]
MKIIVAADQAGVELKKTLKAYLTELGYQPLDPNENGFANPVETAAEAAKMLEKNDADRAVVIDRYGAGSFMALNKYEHVICAEVSDEHSAKMTRDHNNANAIALGSGIVGEDLAKRIVKDFAEAEYSGGRHQIRVDMLYRMGKGGE